MNKSLPPGPRGYPVIGVLPGVLRDPLRCFQSAVRDYGDVVRLPLVGEAIIVVNHPTWVREILQLHHRHYVRSRFHERLKPVLGNGLVTSEGPLWERQRALMQPYFRRQRVDQLTPVIAEVIGSRTAGLVDPDSRTAVIEVERAMTELTLEVFCRAMFGNRLPTERIQTIGQVMSDLVREHSPRLWLRRRLGKMLMAGSDGVQNLVRRLDAIVNEVIRTQRDRDPGDDHLLAALVRELDEGQTGGLLRDEIVTLLFAGHETTTMALAWTLFLLAKHPEVQARVREEASRRPDDLAAGGLEYTTRAIMEAMRLYPPVWRMTRRAAGEQALGEHLIPADATVIVCQYTTQRDERWWSAPDRFDPDRFAGKVDNFAYFPFSRGPRTCMGMHLAMLEMQLIVAAIVARYRLELTDTPVTPKAFFSLRTENGIWLRLTRRD